MNVITTDLIASYLTNTIEDLTSVVRFYQVSERIYMRVI